MLYESTARYSAEVLASDPNQMPPQDGMYRVTEVTTGMVVAIITKARFQEEYAEVPETNPAP